MTTITIRKKYKLETCPFCMGKDLTDVSNQEYSHMFECNNKKCGKITAVEFDK